jgi:tetratricopeptide (TPR) repeat protein
VSPLTLVAHTSLLTGTFPAFHGVRDNGSYLGTEPTTLADVGRRSGYRTGAFVGAFVLDSRWGLNRGFDTYFDDFDLSSAPEGGMDRVQRRGSEVVDHAITWLNADNARPFLAWVHLYDPHAAYEAPDAFASRFPRTIAGAYDAEIAFADAQVGRLLDALASDGRLARTLVVLVGDHGESLGEHREQQHGFFLYDATLRIPMIFAGPTIAPRVVSDQVRIVDVLPTVVEAVGLRTPADVQGESLSPAFAGRPLHLIALEETRYPRLHFGWSELTAIRDGRYKFIRAPRPELYDVQRDPGETHDLASADPARAEAMARTLNTVLTRTTKTASKDAGRKIDREAAEKLRALGYVSGGTGPSALSRGQRGDPKDKIDMYNLLQRAREDYLDKKFDAGIGAIKRVLSDSPEVVDAHTLLGELYAASRNYSAAAVAFRDALKLDPEYESAVWGLAHAYKILGRLDDARTGFERARALNPKNGRAQFELADLSMRRGDFRGAEVLLTDALALNVDRPAFLVKLAECHIELKQYDRAETLLREALGRSPGILRAHYDLGLIEESRGATAAAMAEYEAETTRHPETFSASFKLGQMLSRAGRRADAANRFQAAVAANPEFGAGYLYLAKALLDDGNLTGAEEAARKGLAREPDASIAPLGHYVLADVYNRQGRTREGEREVGIARRLEGKR